MPWATPTSLNQKENVMEEAAVKRNIHLNQIENILFGKFCKNVSHMSRFLVTSLTPVPSYWSLTRNLWK